MPDGQATGIDTKAMLPVYACIFAAICECFLPWISMPVLKYSRMPAKFTAFGVKRCAASLQAAITGGGKLKMRPLTGREISLILGTGTALQACAAIFAVLMCVCVFVVFKKKKDSVRFVRILFSAYGAYKFSELMAVLAGNIFLNIKAGRVNSFANLSVNSYIQAASWVYAGLIVSAAMIFAAGRLLDTKGEKEARIYGARSVKEDRGRRKRTEAALIIIFAAIPFAIFFGIFFLNDRSSVFTGLSIVCLAMLPFAMVFEERKPQAREILPVAVMAAMAAMGRLAFFMVPEFKPSTAIVIIAGAGLGAEAGFLTGAMSGFVSNFFFGQGPWTPWQMFASGIIGFFAGVLFARKKRRKKKRALRRILLCAYGGAAAFVIYGLIMDISSVLNFTGGLSKETVLTAVMAGLPLNFIHAASTVAFLFFLSSPIERKLERLKKKYGILEA